MNNHVLVIEAYSSVLRSSASIPVMVDLSTLISVQHASFDGRTWKFVDMVQFQASSMYASCEL